MIRSVFSRCLIEDKNDMNKGDVFWTLHKKIILHEAIIVFTK